MTDIKFKDVAKIAIYRESDRKDISKIVVTETDAKVTMTVSIH